MKQKCVVLIIENQCNVARLIGSMLNFEPQPIEPFILQEDLTRPRKHTDVPFWCKKRK